MNVFLDRFKFTDTGTFGMLTNDTGNLCFTCELPWKDNQHDISCIPTGVYDVEKYQSPKHGDVWQIMNVPNRSNIEIHPANLPSQLLGCIGVGEALGELYNLPDVTNSQKTFSMLKSILPDNFILTITGEPT